MTDSRLEILHGYGVRWPDVIALLSTMKETGGDKYGTPIERAAFYFRMYVSLGVVEEREMRQKKSAGG